MISGIVAGYSLLASIGFASLWILNVGTSATLDFGNRATPLVLTATGLVFAGVGWLVSSRRPGNTVGWVSSAIGATEVTSTFANEWAILGTITRPGMIPAADIAGWMGNFIWVVPVGLLGVVLVLVFPDGRLPNPRWRPVLWSALIGMAAAMIYFAFAPGPLESLQWIENPFGLEWTRPWIGFLAFGFFVLAAMVPFAAWSMRMRYVSAGHAERAQIRWFGFAAGLVALLYVGQFVYSVATGTLNGGSEAQRWFQTLAIAGFGAMGASVGIAVLRYRLYEIDHILSRTVTYALVIGLLVAGVLSLVAGMTLFLPSDDPLVVAIATLAVFALFNPLRRRVQAMVDRRFNRSRYDAVRVVDDFTVDLRNRTDPDRVLDEWVDVVESTMQPAMVGIWVRTP